jgi:hypothetical protein
MNIKSGLAPCIKFMGTEISNNDFQNCRRIKLRTYELSSVTALRYMFVYVLILQHTDVVQKLICVPTINP